MQRRTLAPMSRSIDFGTWVTVAAGIGLGWLSSWASDTYGLSENLTRAIAYSIGMFALLIAALRPAWQKMRLWGDLTLLLAIHAALIFSLLLLLAKYSIRLNWVLAMPMGILEVLLFLGLLWRRNVADGATGK